jgi:hypothetical protein
MEALTNGERMYCLSNRENEDIAVALISDDCPRVLRVAYAAALTLAPIVRNEPATNRPSALVAAYQNLARIAARTARKYWAARGC